MSKSRTRNTFNQHGPELLFDFCEQRAGSLLLQTAAGETQHKTQHCPLLLDLAIPGHLQQQLRASLEAELSEKPPVRALVSERGQVPELVYVRILVPLIHGQLPELRELWRLYVPTCLCEHAGALLLMLQHAGRSMLLDEARALRKAPQRMRSLGAAARQPALQQCRASSCRSALQPAIGILQPAQMQLMTVLVAGGSAGDCAAASEPAPA